MLPVKHVDQKLRRDGVGVDEERPRPSLQCQHRAFGVTKPTLFFSQQWHQGRLAEDKQNKKKRTQEENKRIELQNTLSLR